MVIENVSNAYKIDKCIFSRFIFQHHIVKHFWVIFKDPQNMNT